jgi:GxxExxY protein
VHVDQQVVYPLNYKGEYIGAYIADMVVENKFIVELKAVSKLNEVMEAQLIMKSRRFSCASFLFEQA